MMKKITTIFIICYIFFTGCSQHNKCDDLIVKIEQNLSKRSITRDSYYIETCVWVHDGCGNILTLEMYLYEEQPSNKVDSCRYSQFDKAYKLKLRLDSLINTDHLNVQNLSINNRFRTN